MAEFQPSKLAMRVRFPSPALQGRAYLCRSEARFGHSRCCALSPRFALFLTLVRPRCGPDAAQMLRGCGPATASLPIQCRSFAARAPAHRDRSRDACRSHPHQPPRMDAVGRGRHRQRGLGSSAARGGLEARAAARLGRSDLRRLRAGRSLECGGRPLRDSDLRSAERRREARRTSA